MVRGPPTPQRAACGRLPQKRGSLLAAVLRFTPPAARPLLSLPVSIARRAKARGSLAPPGQRLRNKGIEKATAPAGHQPRSEAAHLVKQRRPVASICHHPGQPTSEKPASAAVHDQRFTLSSLPAPGRKRPGASSRRAPVCFGRVVLLACATDTPTRRQVEIRNQTNPHGWGYLNQVEASKLTPGQRLAS